MAATTVLGTTTTHSPTSQKNRGQEGEDNYVDENQDIDMLAKVSRLMADQSGATPVPKPRFQSAGCWKGSNSVGSCT